MRLSQSGGDRRRGAAGRRRSGQLALLAALGAGAGIAAPPAPEVGRLHAGVAADAEQRYALYLPSDYDGERRLPVVFAFDLRDGAAELAATLVPAAERFGWIVAAPHGSSNLDSTAANAARMSAVWADVLARFAVDEQRVYVLGFSGMARFACTLAQTAPERVAGVVGLHGGFPEEAPPSAETTFPFFGVVGERDFTFYELVALEQRLAELAVPSRFVHWPGSHERPPPAIVARAFAWLELRAMAGELRAADGTLVEALWSEGRERAVAAESAGRWLAAERDWRALAEDFAPLVEVEPARRRLVELAAEPRLAAERAAAERRLRRDRRHLERVPGILAGAPSSGSPAVLADLLAALEIADLRRQRADHAESAERDSAARVLYAIYVQTGIYAPRRLAERGELGRAALLLRVAAEIEPEVPHVRFRLAVVFAKLGDAAGALAELERAIERGWDDRAAIEGEPAFAALAADERFRALLARLTP
jgi:predicted esterase